MGDTVGTIALHLPPYTLCKSIALFLSEVMQRKKQRYIMAKIEVILPHFKYTMGNKNSYEKRKPPVKNNGDNQNILKPGGFQWNEKIVTDWQNSVN